MWYHCDIIDVISHIIIKGISMINKTKKNKTRFLILPGLVLVMVMLLAGCGGKTEESKASTAAQVDGES